MMKLTARPVILRGMAPGDLPEVLRIDRDCFIEPWTFMEFKREVTAKGCLGVVLEGTGRTMAGYMVAELSPQSVSISRLAVVDRYRRMGLGTVLIDKAKSWLKGDRRRVRLEVRETNLNAVRFYARRGFRAVGVLRDYYGDGEDGYEMHFNGGTR